MFWIFLIVFALGVILVKLGNYSVWMIVFSAGLKLAGIVIAMLAALLAWAKLLRKKEHPIAVKPEKMT